MKEGAKPFVETFREHLVDGKVQISLMVRENGVVYFEVFPVKDGSDRGVQLPEGSEKKINIFKEAYLQEFIKQSKVLRGLLAVLFLICFLSELKILRNSRRMIF